MYFATVLLVYNINKLLEFVNKYEMEMYLFKGTLSVLQTDSLQYTGEISYAKSSYIHTCHYLRTVVHEL